MLLLLLRKCIAYIFHSLQESNVSIYDFVSVVFLAKKVIPRLDPTQHKRRLRKFY